MPAATKLNTAAPLVQLEIAGKLISENLQADATRVPELDVALVTGGGVNASSASYSDAPSDAWLPFVSRKTIQLPPALLEELSVVPRSCGMGLLPEIHCAYIAMNNQLYLWDYAAGTEFLRYEEQPHPIVSVALVRPKANIFIDSIEWVLVIATKSTLLLLGLSRDAASGEIKLYQTDMVCDVDTDMDNVVGTKDGRVFMTGVEDGNLYELHYQVEEGWFTKKIRLNNHTIGALQNILPSVFGYKQADKIVSLAVDDERNYLYTYTVSNSSLALYSLGPAGSMQLTHLGTISSLPQVLSPLLPPGPSARKFIARDKFGIAGLHVIPRAESRSICLVAITFHGLRIYFSDGHSSMYAAGGSGRLRVIHLRFPPPETEQVDMGDVVASAYTNGSFVCAYGSDAAPDSNPLVGASIDIGKLVKAHAGVGGPAPAPTLGTIYGAYPAPRPPLAEFANVINVAGRAWAIRQLIKVPSTQRAGGGSTSIWASGSSYPTALNTLATQFTEPPDQFAVLSNVALTFVMRKRTSDVLRATLEAEAGGAMNGPGHPGGLAAFVDAFGRDETCAQLLAIAAGNTFLSPEAYEPPSYNASGAVNALLGPGRDARLSNLASQAFFERGGKPQWIDRGFGPGAGAGGDQPQGHVLFSGRREGLALYMARLLRPIWNERITSANAAGRQENLINDHVLFNVQKNLNLLQEFLNANQHSFVYNAGELALNRPSIEQEAWKGEAGSMEQLEDLLLQTIEAINFVLFLIDYKISDIIASCDKLTQDTTARLTYADLITSKAGRDVARSLLNAVINQQLSHQIGLDAISETLQQRCGSFCSSDDVMQYKAMENLRRAKEMPAASKEKQACMAEALRLFDKGIANMSLQTLTDVVTEFRELRWPKGAIDLPLRCAMAWDPDNQALEWRGPSRSLQEKVASPAGTVATLHPYGPGVPDHAAVVQEIWEIRMRCYDLALASLGIFNDAHGITSDADMNEAIVLREEAWGVAFESKDSAFHARLYDWCMERGLTDILLNAHTPFLEAHLSRHPISKERLELLWQYHVKNGQFLRSAGVLFQLAETTDLPLSLSERVGYLNLAVGNAMSHAGTEYARQESAVQFLTDVQERLEVAHVQVELLDALEDLITQSGGLAAFDATFSGAWGGLEPLQSSLLTISELYKAYADPLNMYRMKLLIFHVSAYDDAPVVQTTWDAIIDEILQENQSRGFDAQSSALEAEIVALTTRFHPSETALPLDYITLKLEAYAEENRDKLPPAWVPRMLMRGGVDPGDVFNVLRTIYELQVPPFNNANNRQLISSDIAMLLRDWAHEVIRPHSSLSRQSFPAEVINASVDKFMREVTGPSSEQTLSIFRDVKSIVRQLI